MAALWLASPGARAQVTHFTEYTRAKLQWQRAAIHDYQFNFEQTCFCARENSGAMRVTVRNDGVHHATWLNNGQPVSARMLEQVPSIATIFQQIDAGYAKPADAITLTLNRTDGYPERVFIDYYKMMADEELQYTLSDFSH